jgi:hypothetical protein
MGVLLLFECFESRTLAKRSRGRSCHARDFDPLAGLEDDAGDGSAKEKTTPNR